MVCAIDVETTKKPRHLPWIADSYLVSVHLAWEDGRVKSWLINHPESTLSPRQCRRQIQREIDKATRIVAHNLKFDYKWLIHFGLCLDSKQLYCTQVAEYMITGHQKQDGLKLSELSEKYGLPVKLDKVKEYWDAGYETDEVPAHILIEYGNRDSKNAVGIYKQQTPKLQQLGLTRPFALEMEVIPCLAESEMNGLLLDVELLSRHRDRATAELETMDAELCRILHISNASSKQQLSCGLFGGTYKVDGRVPGKRPGTTKNGKVEKYIEGIGFTPDQRNETKTKGIYKVGVDILSTLSAKTPEQREVKALLLKRSRLDQLNKMYFNGFLERVQEDGAVHPNLNQTVTATSRLSSSNPNGQNLPRGNTGPVKECVITRFEEDRNG